MSPNIGQPASVRVMSDLRQVTIHENGDIVTRYPNGTTEIHTKLGAGETIRIYPDGNYF